jgi:CRP-like cAMP-binding protein
MGVTIELFHNETDVERFAAGDTIFREGDRGEAMSTAVARSACRLARIPEKRFLFMVRETPHFALQIMQVMADRLRRMVVRL